MTAQPDQVAIDFDDGPAYERFMGRWSRAAGATFLNWVAPRAGACWLDIGCGTGAFTELVLDTCAPSTIVGIDPSPEQIAFARKQPVGRRADFQVADAQALPFADGSFDTVAAALVLNFIEDRPRALGEIARVGRAGGCVAAFVWDFAAGRAPNSPIALALRRIGANPPAVPGADIANPEALTASFEHAGFREIDTRSFDVTVGYAQFEDFWRGQIPSFSPMAKIIAKLADTDRAKLKDSVRMQLPVDSEGKIVCSARANAIKARIASGPT
jgi:ubiquinone/menaquinone biosynthesis C-methylase UbiE